MIWDRPRADRDVSQVRTQWAVRPPSHQKGRLDRQDGYKHHGEAE